MSINAPPAATRDDSALPDGPPGLGNRAPMPVSPRRFGGVIPEHETPQMLRAAVLRLAWPSIVENLLQSLVQIATTAMVSRLGADALAGVGVGNQLMQVGISTFFAVSTGTTVLVAYNIGAGNPREAGQAGEAVLFHRHRPLGDRRIPRLPLFRATHPAARRGARTSSSEGAKFLRIEALGTIFLVTMFISSGILRGSGDTRTPMLVTLSINFINVGVSLPLIFGLGPLPHLGVVGAACGNIVARFIGSVGARLHRLARAARRQYRRAAGMEAAMDAHQAADRYRPAEHDGIALPLRRHDDLRRRDRQPRHDGVRRAAGGEHLLADDALPRLRLLDRRPDARPASRSARTSRSAPPSRPGWRRAPARSGWRRWASSTSSAARWLVIPFSAGDPQIRSIAANALKVLAFSMPIQATGLVLAGSLRGAGDTRWPMFSTGASMWLVRIPAAYLFGVVLGLGIPGAYLAPDPRFGGHVRPQSLALPQRALEDRPQPAAAPGAVRAEPHPPTPSPSRWRGGAMR